MTYLDPNENGEISIESIEENIREETTLVSLMHINNEIGVVNDIEKIGELCRNKGIIFHVGCSSKRRKNRNRLISA